MSNLAADYLVIGSGAMGMAFTDVLMTETDASVVMIDRRHRPGGHWNDSYPFVRLHQPSAFYGVNSRHLGNDTIDATGWNKGLYELATGAEVCAYFDQVLYQQFLPTGRLQYFPMCEYDGDSSFTSRVTGEQFDVDVSRRVVDATYMNVVVPAMRPPPYDVAQGIRVMPLNDLPGISEPPSGYVVVGAGKTGMDACLWLLANDVDPDRITWIMPRDSWILDRAAIQPGDAGLGVRGFAGQMEAIAGAESIDALFDGLEETGQLLRLDPNVSPTMYRCATVTQAELEQLRRIRDIVRLGRVQRIEPDRIVLDDGAVESALDRVYIDCSADGLARRDPVPVFDGKRMTLQAVRTCQQVFSAAFIAHVESRDANDEQKNELCTPVPHPDSDIDWLRTTLANGLNQARWSQDAELSDWLANARLDFFGALARGLAETGDAEQLQAFQATTLTALGKLQSMIADAEAAPAAR